MIAFDARRHGSSANAAEPYRPVDDLAALLRGLDAAPAVLVGLSTRGATAVDAALEYPELLRALVVSGVGTSEPEFQHPWAVGVFRPGRAGHGQDRARPGASVTGRKDELPRAVASATIARMDM